MPEPLGERLHLRLGMARIMAIGPKQSDLIRERPCSTTSARSHPDEILSKPGKLTPRTKDHRAAPPDCVRVLEKMNFLEREIAIVRHHHEKWNGNGYPDGLSKTTIPLGARILAVADTLDALTSHDPIGTPFPCPQP